MLVRKCSYSASEHSLFHIFCFCSLLTALLTLNNSTAKIAQWKSIQIHISGRFWVQIPVLASCLKAWFLSAYCMFLVLLCYCSIITSFILFAVHVSYILLLQFLTVSLNRSTAKIAQWKSIQIHISGFKSQFYMHDPLLLTACFLYCFATVV